MADNGIDGQIGINERVFLDFKHPRQRGSGATDRDREEGIGKFCPFGLIFVRPMEILGWVALGIYIYN